MAGWGEKLNKMTQTAISKSKEMAEITRLNVEINTFNQNLKEIATQVGEYVLENGLLSEDETVKGLLEQVVALKANIEADQKKLLEAKNISICSKCGAEVSRNSKFCDKCGNEMVIVTETTEEQAQNTCKNCGNPLDEGALFCGNCGTKQE